MDKLLPHTLGCWEKEEESEAGKGRERWSALLREFKAGCNSTPFGRSASGVARYPALCSDVPGDCRASENCSASAGERAGWGRRRRASSALGEGRRGRKPRGVHLVASVDLRMR